MRTERWQATGSPAGQFPREEDTVSADVDEDAEAANDSPADSFGPSLREVHDPDAERESGAPADAEETVPADEETPPFDGPAGAGPVRPFEGLPALPRDLADALENFKLAILNHKLSGWRNVSANDVLAALKALEELILAPSN
jgi:hypothetical protein